MCFVYILKCADNSLYTGWTNNLEKRIDKHNSGNGAKYTRGRLPVELVYFESFETREEAMTREIRIKRMSRSQKIELTKKSSVHL
jgi:putative endonuclease